MKIIVNDLALEYEDTGSGPVILFLHGWQDNLHTFDAVASHFYQTHRVVRLDLPGFGKSEGPKGAWSLDLYVLCVKAFVEKLDITIDVLVGHSFGGRIAIKGKATLNINPRVMVLIGSAGIAHRKTLSMICLNVSAKIIGLLMYIPPLMVWRAEVKKKVYKFLKSDYLETGTLKETFIKIISEDLTLYAKQINIPTLLIWGINDEATPLTEGQRLSSMIKRSQLKIVQEAGHFVHKVKPDEVVMLINEFI